MQKASPLLLTKSPIVGALPVRRAHKTEICTEGRAVQREAESSEDDRSSKRSGAVKPPPRRSTQQAEAHQRAKRASVLNETKGFIKLSHIGKRAREEAQQARHAPQGREKRAGAGEGNAHPRRQAPAERRSVATFCFSLKKQQLSQLLHRGGLRHPPMSDL